MNIRLIGAAALAALLAPAVASSQSVTVIDPRPGYRTMPNELAVAPDGTLWFTEYQGNAIAWLGADGVVRRESSVHAGARPFGVIVAKDGSVWYSEYAAGAIVKRTAEGATSWPLPDRNAHPSVLCEGPDGAIWFVEVLGNKLGRIAPDGTLKEFPLPSTESYPKAIVTGPDGALWFCEGGNNAIGRITVDGAITEYPLPGDNSGPYRMVVGPDGALWFTEVLAGRIGRITTAGEITEFTIPMTGAAPRGITAGPDGALWFVDAANRLVGRLTTAGAFTLTQMPASLEQGYLLLPLDAGFPQGIVTGADGNLWASDTGTSRLYRYALPHDAAPLRK